MQIAATVFCLVTMLLFAAGPLAAQTGGRRSRPAHRREAKPREIAPPQNPTFEDLKSRAGTAREGGNVNDAVALYRQGVQLRPDWAEGWWYLGSMLYELDRYAEARGAFQRFVSLEPMGGPGWAMLGLCNFGLREYERALTNIQKGRSLGLGDSEELKFVTRYHSAILLTRFEEYEAALDILTYFARALPQENPNVVEALGLAILRLPFLPAELPAEKRDLVQTAGRGVYYQFSGKAEEARSEYQKLIATYDQSPNVHYAYGIFLLQDKPEAALEEFRRELEISPSHLQARLQLAFTYLSQHDYTAALPFAEQSVKLAPNSFPARNALGRVLLETGDLKRAITELEVGVNLAPQNPEMYFALARAYSRAGKKQEADQARAKFESLNKSRQIEHQGGQTGQGQPPGTGNAPPR